jgi:hypothetical protein
LVELLVVIACADRAGALKDAEPAGVRGIEDHPVRLGVADQQFFRRLSGAVDSGLSEISELRFAH